MFSLSLTTCCLFKSVIHAAERSSLESNCLSIASETSATIINDIRHKDGRHGFHQHFPQNSEATVQLWPTPVTSTLTSWKSGFKVTPAWLACLFWTNRLLNQRRWQQIMHNKSADLIFHYCCCRYWKCSLGGRTLKWALMRELRCLLQRRATRGPISPLCMCLFVPECQCFSSLRQPVHVWDE